MQSIYFLLCLVFVFQEIRAFLIFPYKPPDQHPALCGVECEHGRCEVNYHRYGRPTYECHCDIGYFGTLCDKATCYVEKCSHHGKCHDNFHVSGHGAHCTCDHHYTGKHCENQILSPITSTAVLPSTTKHYCGFTPCEHGRCELELHYFGVPDYKCHCDHEYFGVSCNIVSCFVETCNDKGTCHNSWTGAHCTCDPNYTGQHCEHEITPSTTATTTKQAAPLPTTTTSAPSSTTSLLLLTLVPAVFTATSAPPVPTTSTDQPTTTRYAFTTAPITTSRNVITVAPSTAIRYVLTAAP